MKEVKSDIEGECDGDEIKGLIDCIYINLADIQKSNMYFKCNELDDYLDTLLDEYQKVFPFSSVSFNDDYGDSIIKKILTLIIKISQTSVYFDETMVAILTNLLGRVHHIKNNITENIVTSVKDGSNDIIGSE